MAMCLNWSCDYVLGHSTSSSSPSLTLSTASRLSESTNLHATGLHPDGFMRQAGIKKLLFLKLLLNHPSDGKSSVSSASQ
jgi:hypothetical protein